ARHRRLGDLAAGTLLLREEKVSLARFDQKPLRAIPVVAPGTGASAAPVPALPTDLAELLTSYLARRDALLPEARLRVAQKLLARLGDHLPEDERRTLSHNPQLLDAWLASRAPVQAAVVTAR